MYHADAQSNVAWFRLAEFIDRGERERALSVYRLLAHAWQDEAYTRALGAELYGAFQDYERAGALYEEAARLYEDTGRPFGAACTYERYLQRGVVGNREADLLVRMIVLFDEGACGAKVQQYSAFAVAEWVASYGPDGAWNTVEQLPVRVATRMLLTSDLLIALASRISPTEHDRRLQENIAEVLVAKCLAMGHEQLATRVLPQLSCLNEQMYHFVHQLLVA